MASGRVVEPVDVTADHRRSLIACVEDGSLDTLGFHGLEERFDHRVVMPVACPGHRDLGSLCLEQRLILN